jgi:hypothetical protein
MVREISDEQNGQWDQESVDDHMEELFTLVVEAIAKKHKLTDKQQDELFDRLCWRLELLPALS